MSKKNLKIKISKLDILGISMEHSNIQPAQGVNQSDGPKRGRKQKQEENPISKLMKKYQSTSEKKDMNEKANNAFQRNRYKAKIAMITERLYNNDKISNAVRNKMFNVSVGASRLNNLKAVYHTLKQVEETNLAVKKGKVNATIKNKRKDLNDTYHLTLDVSTNIEYKTDKKKRKYGQENKIFSKTITAKTRKEAEKIAYAEITQEMTKDDYYYQTINIASVEFIDGVNESELTAQQPAIMPMRSVLPLQYSFTKNDKILLNVDTSGEGECAINHLTSIEPYKFTRDYIINEANIHYNGQSLEALEEVNIYNNIENNNLDIINNNNVENNKPNLSIYIEAVRDLKIQLKTVELKNSESLNNETSNILKKINDIKTYICKINNNNVGVPVPDVLIEMNLLNYEVQVKRVDDDSDDEDEYNLDKCEEYVNELELKITKLNLKYSNLSKIETEGYLKAIHDIKTYIYDVHNGVVGAVIPDIIMQMNSSIVPVAQPSNELIYEDDEDTPTFVAQRLVKPLAQRSCDCPKSVEVHRNVSSISYGKWNVKQGLTPEFIHKLCIKHDISHYAFDVTKKCFLKHLSDNRNKPALMYYAINNHMYLVDVKDRKSLIEKAKSIHNSYNTVMLDNEPHKNKFNGLPIYENKFMELIDAIMKENKSCVFMFSNETKNVNAQFYEFVEKINVIPDITKCNKSNIMQFEYCTDEGVLFIFACDPNDINIIDYKDIIELCKNKALCKNYDIEWKNQTYVQFINELKEKFLDEQHSRITFSKKQMH
jgi:hypothetical protein